MANTKTGSVLVVGAGIAGIQASLDLADSGFYVHLADKDSAIGGVMAKLDKTFPTNDCSMCIISPKLVEAGRHLNIELHTLTTVEEVTGQAGDFTVRLRQKPRGIDPEKCTACGECAKVCPVDIPSQFDESLRTRKAAFKLYPQAMPSAYAIDKGDRAPCRLACPAGLNVQGYVQLVKQGRYQQALEIIMEQLPLPGVLGRICPHGCEDVCRRCQVDEPVAIRDLKRVAADNFDPRKIPIYCLDPMDKKVAIIGSGPAGLSAAYHLAKKGVPSTIFEALPKTGGMLRVGIPEHRLPRDVLDRDIEIITNLGVEIRLNTPLGPDLTVDSLLADGYDAVFLAMGAHKGLDLGIPGQELAGVSQGVHFLKEMNLTGTTRVGGSVAVIGGGNVAIDVARSAVRLGARSVSIVYRRTRAEMPAWEEEIQAAEHEGVKIVYLAAPVEALGQGGRVTGLRCIRMKLGEPDRSGRRRPEPIPGSEYIMGTDQVIQAIGQQPDLGALDRQETLGVSRWGTLDVDPVTYATGRPGVFAGGDVQTGPDIAIAAIAAGMEAAESIARYLTGADMASDREKPRPAREADYLPIPPEALPNPRRKPAELDLEKRTGNFLEVDLGLDPDQGKEEASRCLNCGYCSECMQCVDACLAEAVDHTMMPRDITVKVGAIILAPGFTPFDPSRYETYGYGRTPNVVTSLEFERLLSASGPNAGHLVRPSDGRDPGKIAWLQCVGSRDINKGGHSYCSGVCCMISTKQAVIAKEHSDIPLDTAIFFMDMRTHGKGFDAYQIRAQDDSGVRFIRSRIHSLFPAAGDTVRIVYATESGSTAEEIFDMAVLSIGLAPSKDAQTLARTLEIDLNPHGFAGTHALDPVATSREGVYVCGTFQEPKDIPFSVMEASAAASCAAQGLADQRWSLTKTRELVPEIDVIGQAPRIGVFVCNCGINIGGIADVPAVRDYAATLAHVVYVEDNLFTCSQDTQDHIKHIIAEKKINRVVVASCSPRTHEPLFQETIRDAGLNKYLFEMANIRDQNTWVHMNSPKKATAKAKDLVRMAVAKAARVEPLHQVSMAIHKSVLVVGGGVSGMIAALGVADQGMQAFLVEKSDQLGGAARHLRATWQGEPVAPFLEDLIGKTFTHPNIRLFLNAEVTGSTGSLGNFITRIRTHDGRESPVEHGAAILATGGTEYRPTEYLYGQNPNVLTHLEMDALMTASDSRALKASHVVFIQCVGSRNKDHPYCSRLCCTHSLKTAIGVKTARPRTRVTVIYRDIRSYGFREDLYKDARSRGVIFVRYEPEAPPQVSADTSGNLEVRITDHVLRRPLTLKPDLLVLASAIRPTPNQHLFETFKVPVNSDGFLVEAHAKLRPVDFASDGLFVAGLAHYPKPLEESIAQARAAVARAMTIVSRDSIQVGGVVAEVDKDRCAVCLTCVRACPYEIPFIHEDGYAVIEASECHGCGVCVSECPGKAIRLNHFTDQQIMAKTDALFET
ncbi:MAG: FAD-dependent oxidoreductase [Pseudomonadota bacterium]